jgi:RNA polymerase sigma-70 factor, ECF subfamily
LGTSFLFIKSKHIHLAYLKMSGLAAVRSTNIYMVDNLNLDIQWVNQIAQQKQFALSKLYDRYAKTIYSLAYRRLGSAEESEEVVADVFVQVWRLADRYDPARARVETWLLMMARTRIFDRLRNRLKQEKITDTLMLFELPLARPSPCPSEDLEFQERRAIVIAALEKLPSEQFQVLELAYYRGYSHREISERTGIALGTVKTRIRLGLEKLRSALQFYGKSP